MGRLPSGGTCSDLAMEKAKTFIRIRAQSTNFIPNHLLDSYKHGRITQDHYRRIQTPLDRVDKSCPLSVTNFEWVGGNTSSESYMGYQ